MTRLDEIEQRLAALEQRPPCPRYVGIWRTHAEYVPGDLATHNGGLWLVARQTSAKPGTPDSGWTLVCKAGAFGRREDVLDESR